MSAFNKYCSLPCALPSLASMHIELFDCTGPEATEVPMRDDLARRQRSQGWSTAAAHCQCDLWRVPFQRSGACKLSWFWTRACRDEQLDKREWGQGQSRLWFQGHQPDALRITCGEGTVLQTVFGHRWSPTRIWSVDCKAQRNVQQRWQKAFRSRRIRKDWRCWDAAEWSVRSDQGWQASEPRVCGCLAKCAPASEHCSTRKQEIKT